MSLGERVSVMALARGPYGTVLALVWDRSHNAEVIQLELSNLEIFVVASWEVSVTTCHINEGSDRSHHLPIHMT